uniref:XRN2-binding (XTBD) domain-containing protein n=1 Tax=Anopheles atroparvus TaxID=41427 RepID=A0AAG5CRP3_ANOAO
RNAGWTANPAHARFTPYDTDSLWNLKKWFMELHKDTIPEAELVPLAQAFANVEAQGCCYGQELMDLLKHLGEPIARVYRNLKHNKYTPTMMLASKAARLHRYLRSLIYYFCIRKAYILSHYR